MGQMTFTFETEEKKPEEQGKEIEKVKTKEKPKAEKKEEISLVNNSNPYQVSDCSVKGR